MVRSLRVRWSAGFGVLIAVTVAAYWPALRGPQLWNDSDYLTSPALRGWSGLAKIWFQLGATQQYYPVVHTAFWIQDRLWGASTVGYHLANVGFHAAAAGCLVLTLSALGLKRGAWAGGLLFALHPVMVESVAWISEEKNTLSAVFYLLAAWLYLRGPNRRIYWLATGCFVLAVLAKSVAATLPAALLIVAWYRHRTLRWRADVRPLVPWFGIGSAAGLFTAWVEHTYIGAQGAAFALSWAQRTLIAGRVFWFYLGKLLWPHPLIFIYPRWRPDAADGWHWVFPAAAAALFGLLWVYRLRWPSGLTAAACFAVAQFPVLGFLNVYAFVFSFVADHLQYLAAIAPISLLAAAWERWGRATPSSVWPAIAAAVVVGLCGILTWRQAANYRSVERFYAAILVQNPSAWMAQNNLGIYLDAQGKTAEALGRYRAALALDPENADIENNLGAALTATGHPEEALRHLTTALRDRPHFPEAVVNLAAAHGNLGVDWLHRHRPTEAIAEFAAALRLDPRLTAVRLDLGVALAAAGQPQEAEAVYQEVLRARPTYAEAHNDLGLLFARTSRMDRAVAEFRAAVAADPAYASAHYNLGVALQNLGQVSEAQNELQAASRLDPHRGNRP